MNENWPGAFAPSQRYIEPSKRPMRAMRYLTLHLPDEYLIARVVEKILVATFKVIFKAEDLKTIVSTDDPKLELRPIAIPLADPIPIALGLAVAGIAYEEAGVTRYPIHRSIGGRVP